MCQARCDFALNGDSKSTNPDLATSKPSKIIKDLSEFWHQLIPPPKWLRRLVNSSISRQKGKASSSHSPLEDLQQGFKCPQCAAPRRRFARKLGDKIGTTLDGAWGEEINLVRSGGKCGFSGVRLGDLEKSEQHEHLFGCANLLWFLDMFIPLSLNKLTIYFLWTWGRPRAICFVVWLFKV